ncbi:aminoglycoside phosphotransferase family protein [Lentzea sp. NPDC042327]|uniref:aminoglycoside phosphotransferase family protein n=1 Tax=Lentzea sp. NPDC042327 TaxID=3154801 RepID=UPI0033E6ED9C
MERLTGGGINDVYRVGQTVRRPVGPWSPRVHGLLRHLRERGFTGAPDFHGIDEEGREILTFFPGEVCNYPLSPAARSEEALVSAARLLRSYHDATASYDHRTGWMMPVREPAEVVCHGDFAPYNCVLDGTTAVALIDFDTAHPAPRLWDVAYAVYRWAPLTHPDNHDGFGTAARQAARAARFCNAYGLADRSGLVAAVAERLTALVELMHARADAGDRAFARHIADGHDRLYLRDAEYVRTTMPGMITG